MMTPSPAIFDLPGIGWGLPVDDRATRAAQQTADFLRAHRDVAFGRDPHIGHITASGFVVSPDRTRTLLMHHRKLDLWLQPGGHCDGDTDVRRVARREALEETGLARLRLVDPAVFDVDVHVVPARGDTPAHRHHDVRFLFEADPALPVPGNHESFDLQWIAMDDLDAYTSEASVLVVRAARRV